MIVAERILSISGLRGIVGDGLDPNFVVKFSQALGILSDRGTVVVGRDGRSTGKMLKLAVQAGLESVGCQVIDAGIVSTPTCGFLVRHFKAAAGIEITASHNPIEWNGLKPFSREGSVFNEDAGRRLLDLLETDALKLARWNSLGSTEERLDAGDAHLEKVCELVEVPAIRTRRLKVVLDCNHGAGGLWGPKLLQSLGCEVTILGGTPDGLFDHAPEPLKENLRGLCDAVRRQGADVGFAQDPDADRLAVVDNHGRYIGEELTLALCADYVLERTPGPVVVNGSTSRVTADVAARSRLPLLPLAGGRSARRRENAGGRGRLRRRRERRRDRTEDRLRARQLCRNGVYSGRTLDRPPKSRRMGRRTPLLFHRQGQARVPARTGRRGLPRFGEKISPTPRRPSETACGSTGPTDGCRFAPATQSRCSA